MLRLQQDEAANAPLKPDLDVARGFSQRSMELHEAEAEDLRDMEALMTRAASPCRELTPGEDNAAEHNRNRRFAHVCHVCYTWHVSCTAFSNPPQFLPPLHLLCAYVA